MADLRLAGIGKSFGAVEILKNINLHIEAGELFVLVGPSGCGKSTLLRMIAGLEQITAGTLEIDGVRMNEVPPARRGIAMVFQSYALYPHMSVRQNMGFALRMAGQGRAEIDAAVTRTAHALQLGSCLDRLPAALSGGQRQRVAIGRAILRDPWVYLFDEPLSNLDAALRVATRIEIAKLKQAMPDRTMIYVTHDQVEAMTLADRIAVLGCKGIAQVGAPLTLYRKPRSEFVARFIGSPAMNLLAGEIVQTGEVTMLRLARGGGSIAALVPTCPGDKGRRVTVGIRPEHMYPTESATHALAARVELVEVLGEVTQLHFAPCRPGGQTVIARLPGIHAGLHGRTLRIAAAPENLHLFAEGRSLLYR
ncbi:maltose ABC transporter ATP-binding protein /trehalose ABC transporter ATP-binding protein /sucrose ABC transporter ATP-binding protein [Rhodovulum bhavnagarense]|uniref:Maltose ABC transporter ATP-binding protein /trehalose ABC transporter ATP-binding protein /sucrose ABC transporter ATP-binding protein n=1 Tax=Rhodovulum bhavnagarense TaxID=992286 RepID=A0A4R2RCP8_9RHOB|nr:ABC transporter ATP-binding protein [Rhodovulum bhavnagarense]TCP59747.1 maltose ABC transporter ATP-binding protein /trehalose ABC transporter ATP-binding protein /sucrose ABC transporter ATP-binding protein [Rhodovulum bhavnagarense]